MFSPPLLLVIGESGGNLIFGYPEMRPKLIQVGHTIRGRGRRWGLGERGLEEWADGHW